MAGYESRLRDQEGMIASLTRWQQQQMAAPPPQGVPTPSGSRSGSGSAPVGFPSELAPPAMLSPSHDPSHAHPSPGGLSTTSFSDPRILPADEIVTSLINLYYTHVWPWAPILPRQAYSAPWGIVPHAIVVLALRLSDDPRLDRLPGGKQALRQAAKAHVLSHAVESTSIASMQALSLLALDLIGSEQGPSSWGTLALLTRSAAHLGLMTEDDPEPRRRLSGPQAPSSLAPFDPRSSLSSSMKRRGVQKRTAIVPPPATWEEDEARRRLFWLVLVLDRYASASTGWDFALRDSDIKRRLPSSDTLWFTPPPPGSPWPRAPLFAPVLHRDPYPPSVLANLSPMVFLIEAVDLLGRSHTLHSSGGSAEEARDAALALTAACRRWAAELPRLEGSLGLTVLALHHATLLKVNAYHAFPASGGSVAPFRDRCAESTSAVAELCRQQAGLGWRGASPLFIWGAWVAARVVFITRFVAHSADSGGVSGVSGNLASDPEFSVLLASLRDASRHWSLASQYVRLLDAAARRWSSGQVSTPSTRSHPAPGTGAEESDDEGLPDAIRVLLDLRRTAYNAVGAGEETPPEEEGVRRPSMGEGEREGGLGAQGGAGQGVGVGVGAGVEGMDTQGMDLR